MATGHGGNLRELARRAGLSRDDILDFSASINPLGPPEGLRAAIARGIDRLVHYPYSDSPNSSSASRNDITSRRSTLSSATAQRRFFTPWLGRWRSPGR